MISSVSLTNFQIHKKLDFNLTAGMNLIYGSNDSGKSSIVRALHWCFLNSPSGDWMCRIDDSGKTLRTSVKVTFNDDTVICRIRDGKKNIYFFNNEEFSHFGNDVPTPIVAYLKRIDLNLVTTNQRPGLHMQDDQPFMVFESKNAKGGLVNYLTGLDIADRIKKSVSGDLNAAKATRRALVDLRKETVTLIESMKGCEKLASDADKIRTKIDIHTRLVQRYKALVRYHDRLVELQRRQKQYRSVAGNSADMLASIDSVDLKVSVKNKLEKKLKKLTAVRDQFDNAIKRRDTIARRLAIVRDQLKELDGTVCESCGEPIEVTDEYL